MHTNLKRTARSAAADTLSAAAEGVWWLARRLDHGATAMDRMAGRLDPVPAVTVATLSFDPSVGLYRRMAQLDRWGGVTRPTA